MKKKPILTFIIEEHHEAFIVWNEAIQNKWIPSTNNCLFHVDEHADMQPIIQLNETIYAGKGNIEKIKSFTYNELNIESFIIPACYLHIFNEVYWIKQKHINTNTKPIKQYVRSYNQAGRKLYSGNSNLIKNNNFPKDSAFFDYYYSILDELPDKKKVILDIDLDFFSCNSDPIGSKEYYIEITREEFNDFTNNKYHYLKYSGLRKIEAIQKGEKSYYAINNFKEIYPSTLMVSHEMIENRITLFVEILKKKKIQPLLIDICRSRFSGYTPSGQWEFIENKLINGLQEIYETEPIIYSK